MEKFFTLLEKGIFTTRVVTLTLTATCVYLWINGVPLDETLKSSWLIIIGFWFNSELSTQIIRWLMEKK